MSEGKGFIKQEKRAQTSGVEFFIGQGFLDAALAVLPSRFSSFHLRKAASLDVAAYPHILQRIIDFSTRGTLANLIRCDRHTFGLAIVALYRILSLTYDQFVRLIARGWGKSHTVSNAQEETPDASPPAFSPSLLEALRHTQHIHLWDYSGRPEVPAVPADMLKALLTVVIYPSYIRAPATAAHCAEIDTTSIDALNAPHLIIRMSDTAVASYVYTMAALPLATREVTFITPFADRLKSIPTLALTEAVDVARSVPLTIVLCPVAYDDLRDWSKMFTKRRYFPPSLLKGAAVHPVTLVGSEYLATERIAGARRPRDVLQQAAAAFQTTTPRSKELTRVAFRKWVREQEVGVIFTQKETAAMKKLDSVTMKSYKGWRYKF